MVASATMDQNQAPIVNALAAIERRPLDRVAGRITGETIGPAPFGVPRLDAGERTAPAHVAWFAARRDAGALFHEPIAPGERRARVVAP